jgi:hypothetical protein
MTELDIESELRLLEKRYRTLETARAAAVRRPLPLESVIDFILTCIGTIRLSNFLQ